MGHARAILGCKSAEQQLTLYKRILRDGLSVRRVEEWVSNAKPVDLTPRAPQSSTFTDLQQRLESTLGAKVRLSGKSVTISFKNEQQLQQLIHRIL